MDNTNHHQDTPQIPDVQAEIGADNGPSIEELARKAVAQSNTNADGSPMSEKQIHRRDQRNKRRQAREIADEIIGVLSARVTTSLQAATEPKDDRSNDIVIPRELAERICKEKMQEMIKEIA